MKNSKKYVEIRKLHNEDYLCDVGLEVQDNIEVRSISSASRNGRDDKNRDTSNLMEKILHRDNLNQAYKKVKKNKGSSGVDGMTVDELLEYLKRNNNQLQKDLIEESYTPMPVRYISINEGMKKLKDREKLILNLRFFDGKTQMEVADEIGISQAQVSRVEKNALKHMRKYL